MRRLQLTLILLALTAANPFAQVAQARGYVSFGIGIYPGYYGGGYPYYGYGYGYGYPYYYPPAYAVPAPVVYQAAPAPAAVIVRPAPSTPAPYVASSTPITDTVQPASYNAPATGNLDPLLQRLADPKDTVRRDAAVDLGRLKAQRAIDPLLTTMAKDASPIARDGAARALGLIGAPRSLNALIYTAQADNDRDVRHSAQFAVEVIRNNLRGR